MNASLDPWLLALVWAVAIAGLGARPDATRVRSRSAGWSPDRSDRPVRDPRSLTPWLERPRIRRGGVALAVVLVVAQQVALAALVALAFAAPQLLVRRARARTQVEIDRRLPELVDVVRLGALSGLPLRDTVTLAASVLSGPVASVLGRAVDDLGRGRRLPDVMASVGGELGPDGHSMVAVVMAAEIDGTDVAAALADLATDLRRARAARAEARARRLPILMLFPLVTCVLPAFALLSVVPVVVAGISEALHSA